MSTSPEPVWRTALSGAQILLVAFSATVLVPLLTGLNPSLALLGAGIGGLGVTIGSFSLQGISLCGVLAALLNLILPPRELEEEIKPAAFP